MAELWLLVAIASLAAFILHTWRRRRRESYGLPRSVQASRLRKPVRIKLRRDTEVSGSLLLLRVETTLFNPYHDAFATWIRQQNTANRTLRIIYNIGAISGVLGMCYAIGFMVWSIYQQGVETKPNSSKEASFNTPNKTSSDSYVFPDGDQAYGSELPRLLIPGWTLPLSDLPVLLLSLLICQIIHEAGHAVSAALDGIPLLSAGITLAGILPSAFVSLPNNYATSRRDSSKVVYTALRVSSSGAWHNLIFWVFLLFVSWTNITQSPCTWELFGYGAWRNVLSKGVAVLSIAKGSSLQEHIPISSVITGVDDVRLGGEGIRNWHEFFWNTNQPRIVDGWCVSKSWYEAQHSECCQKQSKGGVEGFCFIPSLSELAPSDVERLALGRCVDPVALFTRTSSWRADERNITVARCQTSCLTIAEGERSGETLQNTQSQDICIRPKQDTNLMRLSIEYPPWRALGDSAGSAVVVWNGPHTEVWEQIQVGSLQPRYWWIPANMPAWTNNFFRYTSTITFSLFCFNLLPLPLLDGSQVLSDALDVVIHLLKGSAEEQNMFQLEAGEAFQDIVGGARYGYYKAKLERSIQSTTLVVLVLMLCLTFWNDAAG
ncbi:hypothetical protein FRC03_011836 [Tulasnella sp. 419]|nr:hypothetical protein FRC03_011836 [Tulasnella sp. 419]